MGKTLLLLQYNETIKKSIHLAGIFLLLFIRKTPLWFLVCSIKPSILIELKMWRNTEKFICIIQWKCVCLYVYILCLPGFSGVTPYSLLLKSISQIESVSLSVLAMPWNHEHLTWKINERQLQFQLRYGLVKSDRDTSSSYLIYISQTIHI